MSTRIRLQRHGKKGKPFFHIVVADSRSKRDGRFIEKLGTYNPNTNPATIDLDFDRSVNWVTKGVELSDTARAILSYKGVLMKEHLMRGVAKGALTEEQMEAKFSKWLEDKGGRIQGKVDRLAKSKSDSEKARLASEKEKNEARAAALAAAAQPEIEEAPEATDETSEASAEATAVQETPVAEAQEEAVAETEVKDEAETEAPVAEETAPEAEASSDETSEKTRTKKANTSNELV
ncbi:MAG: 30S ribosomal protein S16 [Flavobacteriales bacterium]